MIASTPLSIPALGIKPSRALCLPGAKQTTSCPRGSAVLLSSKQQCQQIALRSWQEIFLALTWLVVCPSCPSQRCQPGRHKRSHDASCPYGHRSGATRADGACDCTGQGMNLLLELVSPRLEHPWQWGEVCGSPPYGGQQGPCLAAISLRHLVLSTAGSLLGAFGCAELCITTQKMQLQPVSDALRPP